VKAEIVKADADLICEGINGTFAKWVTRWNHGDDVAPPKVYRVLDDAEDLDKVAERDSKLDQMGIERTDESIEQVYGEGYQRKPKPDPAALPPALPGRRGAAANDDEQDPAIARRAADRRAEFDAHEPTPLYVSRRLQNADDVLAWARAQGFKNLERAEDLHVTILYSRKPVDWFGMGETWSSDPKGGLTVPAGGPRKVEALGDKGAIVLHFASSDLRWRHEGMVERGASHDFDDYFPHVTFTYDGGDVDLTKVQAYEGELRFGPERFEELVADPDPLSLFEAVEEDEIERLTAALLAETNPILAEFGAAVVDTLKAERELRGGVLSVQGARVALLQAFEQFPADRLARLTGLPLVAQRAAAEAGVEDRVTA
jgi:hypothetical protein